MKVDFEHWRYCLSEEALVRYGSPHFPDAEAGHHLRDLAVGSASKVEKFSTIFRRSQIICANEAFPEAAVADPISDLEIWNEWNSGIRAFPYPGRYSRLGIRGQLPKTSSSSSVGVLGEVMAGLFCQAYVSPWVLVRVIRRWPDFIFYTDGPVYAFVEAKAFTESPGARAYGLSARIPDKLLGQCLVDAVGQLNADAYTVVWGMFTRVVEISPMSLEVTALEIDIEPSRRQRQEKRFLPEPVIRGLAERAIAQGASRLHDENLALLAKKRKRKKPSSPEEYARKQAEETLRELAFEELEGVLVNAGSEVAISQSRSRLQEEISKAAESVTFPEDYPGKRFFSAKERAATGHLAELREIGDSAIMIADLPVDARLAVEDKWQPNWQAANEPWKVVGEIPFWRCGGAVFCLGPQSMVETPL